MTQPAGQSSQSRRLPWMVIGLTLLILAAVILLISRQLRSEIRTQIVGRDGEILHAVALMHQLQYSATNAVAPLEEPLAQLTLLLETSRLKGVLAARLFAADGKFVAAFPPGTAPAALLPGSFPRLEKLKPVSRFLPEVQLNELFPDEASNSAKAVSLLEVSVPIHHKEGRDLLGIAQFILDGQSIAADFATLDKNLRRNVALTFFIGGTIVTIALLWAFRLLAQRTESLLKANNELALNAKTSAVGSVTAHLIHGLKNPLSGLQNFVSSRPGDSAKSADEWQAAEETTRRMQKLVNDIVRVLSEEKDLAHYEITAAELACLLEEKISPSAREAEVLFSINVKGCGVLSNRDANLMLLILENILRNAVQATPKGKAVQLSICVGEDGLTAVVQDEGPGLPESTRANLFSPCQSTKPGGSGLGLAISKQLAKHLGAKLELQSSDSSGTTFVLFAPKR